MDWSVASEYRTRAEECAHRAQLTEDEIVKADWVHLAQAWQVLAENAEKQTGFKLLEFRLNIDPPNNHNHS